MKELEKVKRISIASILFILVILIGVLTFERPQNMYVSNTKTTLEKLTTSDYFINIKDIDEKASKIIDIRSQYEYEKGHLENAINMASPEILTIENLGILNETKELNKTIVIYGKNPQEANIPFLILHQLGFDNIKILSIEIGYIQNKLIMKQVDIERPNNDIKSFIDESIKKAEVTPTTPIDEPNKKPIVLKKKKKKAPEGGC